MENIVYLPLDERPCNYKYPLYLASMTDLNMIAPDLSLLGKKKLPAKVELINNWLLDQTLHAGYLLVSIDMLVYGGILPSRLHTEPPEDCRERLNLLRKLKEMNPKLRIFAFNLITRAPAYSSSEEEPEYYADFGRELYELGWLNDKAEQEGLNELEQEKLSVIKNTIPVHVLADFVGRRQTNMYINECTIELVADGTIDYLVIPLDDNSKFGYTSVAQRRIAAKVEQLDLVDRIAIYPGADEIGCTLFARLFCEIKQFSPLVYVRYSSTNGPFCIPKYEDRSLNESVKHQIIASGAMVSDEIERPDIYLMVHSPAVGETHMAETMDPYEGRHRSYFSEVNIREFVQAVRHYVAQGKLVALADVALCNGGDHSLMKLLSKYKLFEGLACYAAWNTSGNSLGTVISHAVIEAYNNTVDDVPMRYRQKSREYYYYRLIEDWGYQSVVRQDVSDNHLACLGASYFHLSHVQEQVENLIQVKLNQFIVNYLSDTEKMHVDDVQLPWDRMFEIGFEIRVE